MPSVPEADQPRVEDSESVRQQRSHVPAALCPSEPSNPRGPSAADWRRSGCGDTHPGSVAQAFAAPAPRVGLALVLR